MGFDAEMWPIAANAFAKCICK